MELTGEGEGGEELPVSSPIAPRQQDADGGVGTQLQPSLSPHQPANVRLQQQPKEPPQPEIMNNSVT